MLNMTFNPFHCELKDISVNHLNKLRTLAEGWYVEYKSQCVDTKSIAKSLASFANHQGGWIFYGVDEPRDEEHVANSFPGITRSDLEKLIENLKNAAKDCISPAPYYEHHILEGPCDEVSLNKDKYILVVAVPKGPNTPYIHSDGRVYRRTADSSTPLKEIDRVTLDNLWNNRKLAHENLTKFLLAPNTQQHDATHPYIELFLMPDPLAIRNQFSDISFDEFVKLMAKKDSEHKCGFIPFDNFFTTPNSFVARQIGIGDPYKIKMTWKFHSNGFSLITTPLSRESLSSLTNNANFPNYIHKNTYANILTENRYKEGTVLDLNQLGLIIISVLTQNLLLLKKSNIQGDYYAKVKINNVLNTIPFLDTKSFIDFIEKCGVPLMPYNSEYIPDGQTIETLIQLKNPDYDQQEITEEDLTGIYDGFHQIGRAVFSGLGIPYTKLVTAPWTEENCIFTAAQRAQKNT